MTRMRDEADRIFNAIAEGKFVGRIELLHELLKHHAFSSDANQSILTAELKATEKGLGVFLDLE